MDQAPESFPCTLLGGSQAVLHLRCTAPFVAAGITAWLDGIEVGHLRLPSAPRPGDDLSLPLARLPRVPLPAELRLGTAERDLAAAIPLRTPADAAALFGAGQWRAEDLALRHGVLHGALRNADNGLAEPQPFARVNASLSRPLLLGQPATLADGAALWPFQLPLQPDDLLEAGLTIVLHVANQEAPLATLAWSRLGADAQAQRLTALEARLQEAMEASDARLAQLGAEQRRLHLEQQARVDAFIEYAGALLLDRVAATASAPTAEAADLAALRALIASAAPLAALAGQAAPDVPDSTVLPASPQFSFGWHQLERDAGGDFRWMGEVAAITNPSPDRAVAQVVVHLRHLYDADRPALTARLDGAQASTTVEGEGPADWRLRITPTGPVPCRTLRLTSKHHASPAERSSSTDTRVLSVAVSRVEFRFLE
jgi:hypothetical protein